MLGGVLMLDRVAGMSTLGEMLPALVLTGPANSGKTLIALACAQIYGSPHNKPKDAYGRFTADEIKDTTKETSRYSDILSKIPSIVTAANQELEKQSKLVDELRKKTVKLQGAFDIAVLTQGLGRIATRIVQLVQAGQLEVNEQLKATELARTANLAQQRVIQSRLIAQQQNLNRVRKIDETTLDGLVSLTLDQVSAAGESVNLERRIRTLRIQEFQARTVEARERLATEQKNAKAQLEGVRDRLNLLNQARQRGTDRLAGDDPAIAREIDEAINERVRLTQQLNVLRVKERDISASIRDTEKEIGRQAALRVSAFVATQIPALRQSNKLLELEVSLLKERTSLFLDRDVIGERRQRLTQQRQRLDLTRRNQKEENKASIEALRNLRRSLSSSRAQQQVDAAVVEINARERLQAEQFNKQNTLLNKQLGTLTRQAQALAKIRPISSVLRAKPELQR